MAVGCSTTDPSAADPTPDEPSSIRVATFNASLNRSAAGQLVTDLSAENAQARAVADVISANSPDVLLINEFDYVPRAVGLFRDNYLAVAHHGSTPVNYPYAYIAPSNTGVPSGCCEGAGGAGRWTARVFSPFCLRTMSKG